MTRITGPISVQGQLSRQQRRLAERVARKAGAAWERKEAVRVRRLTDSANG